MKRLLGTTLVSVFLTSMVFGVSPAFASSEVNLKQTVTSVAISSDNQTTRQVYAVNNEVMEELDRLLKRLKEAELEDDRELINALREKIQAIKEEIRKASETSSVTGESETPQSVADKPTVVARKVTAVSTASRDKCAELRAMEEKKKHYEAMYALSDDELKDKGYRGGKEDIRNIIAKLEVAIKRLRLECEAGVNNSAGGDTTTSPTKMNTETVAIRPIAVESGGEITDYYRRRIAEIAIEEVDIEKKVTSLKELRDDIDRLIEALIRSRDEISTEEVRGLVTRIVVKPGEVKMDNVVVKTIDKSVIARVNNKDLEIKPTDSQVILQDDGLRVKASELSIEDGVLRVGDSEVKLRPRTVIDKIKIEPKEIELKEENARAVYRIKADENRKLFGFIPVKVERTLTVDAEDEEVKVIKEKRPWWAFLTVK